MRGSSFSFTHTTRYSGTESAHQSQNPAWTICIFIFIINVSFKILFTMKFWIHFFKFKLRPVTWFFLDFTLVNRFLHYPRCHSTTCLCWCQSNLRCIHLNSCLRIMSYEFQTKENTPQLGIPTLRTREVSSTPSSASDVDSTWLLTASTANKLALLYFRGV